jgi:hypothetical protein
MSDDCREHDDKDIDLVASIGLMRGTNDALADAIVEANIQDIVVPFGQLHITEPVYVLGQFNPVDTFTTIDTTLCYICGRSNFDPPHLDADGWAIPCPTRLTRERADDVRRARGETVP